MILFLCVTFDTSVSWFLVCVSCAHLLCALHNSGQEDSPPKSKRPKAAPRRLASASSSVRGVDSFFSKSRISNARAIGVLAASRRVAAGHGTCRQGNTNNRGIAWHQSMCNAGTRLHMYVSCTTMCTIHNVCIIHLE